MNVRAACVCVCVCLPAVYHCHKPKQFDLSKNLLRSVKLNSSNYLFLKLTNFVNQVYLVIFFFMDKIPTGTVQSFQFHTSFVKLTADDLSKSGKLHI